MTRKEKGFTLVELMIVLAIIAIVATLAITNLVSSQMAGNEVAAIKTLKAIAESQATFRRLDPDGDGADYALTLDELRDGAGALMVTAAPTEGSTNKGYTFNAIAADENGAAYDATTGYGFCAFPTTYQRSGVRTFIVDSAGTVYANDTGAGAVVAAWPAQDPTTAGWVMAE